MAKKFITNVANSKIAYGEYYEEGENKFPGNENIKIGCMQRIADATEAMAGNYLGLQREVESLKISRETYRNSYNREINKNRALRGVITKLKNKLKNQQL